MPFFLMKRACQLAISLFTLATRKLGTNSDIPSNQFLVHPEDENVCFPFSSN